MFLVVCHVVVVLLPRRIFDYTFSYLTVLPNYWYDLKLMVDVIKGILIKGYPIGIHRQYSSHLVFFKDKTQKHRYLLLIIQ